MKKAISLVMAILISIGACGCMDKKNYESEISIIKEVIEQRYGEDFDVEYFLPAKDKTYDNILTLSDKDGVVFNAYQSGDSDDITDDYHRALVNDKLAHYIVDTLNVSSELEVRIMGTFADGSALTVDYAKDYEVSHLNQDFIKLVTVVLVKDEISKYKDELFDIYKETLKFNPELIEFEVVSCDSPGEALSKAINNSLGYYNNNWDDFKEISNYIDIRTKNITSAYELIEEVK